MTRLMTVMFGVLAFTACETEEEIEMWEAALSESSNARSEVAYEAESDEDKPFDCTEAAQHFDTGFDDEHGQRRSTAFLPARGNLACGQQNDIYTNGTDRKKVCTIEYENECGNSNISGGLLGPHRLSTTQNGGTADIDIDVAPGQTLTFNCNGSGDFDPKSKCSYKSSCKDAPKDASEKLQNVVFDY